MPKSYILIYGYFMLSVGFITVLLEKVRVVLNDIKKEGLVSVFKTHIRLARATRAAVQAFGLSMIAPDNPADSTKGVFVSNGVDGEAS